MEILKFAVSDNLPTLHFYTFSTGYIGERQNQFWETSPKQSSDASIYANLWQKSDCNK